MSCKLFFTVALQAQEIFSEPVVLTTYNGLPSNNIKCLAEGSDGFMWIGTDKGLSRYDGSLFENFYHSDEDPNSLRSDHILDILSDQKNGRVWVAHTQGISAYDIKNRQFKNYFHNSNNLNSIPDHRAYSFFMDQDSVLWIGFQAGGLVKYRPGQDDFERYLCDNENSEGFEYYCEYGVTKIVAAPNDSNVLWLATHYGLLEFFKKSGEFNQYVFNNNDKNTQYDLNNIVDLFPSDDEKIYCGTYRKGVVVFDILSKSFSIFSPCGAHEFEEFHEIRMSQFHPINNQQFWVISNAGAQLLDIQSGCIEKSIPNQATKKYAFDYIDKEGRIWSTSADLGLFIYNPLHHQSKQLHFETQNSIFSSRTRKIIEDTKNKKLYILPIGSRGLFIYDQIAKTWKCIPPAQQNTNYESRGFHATDMIFMPDGKLLILENSKIYWYEPGFTELQLFPLQLEATNPRIRNIIQDHLGDFWISTSTAGIYLMGKDGKQLVKQEIILAEEDFLWGCDFMAEDVRGNIWMREHDGLLVFERAKNIYHYFPHDPEGQSAVRGMGPIETDEQGNIWIAGHGDYFAHAHADSLEKGTLGFYGKKEGLRGDHVYFVKPYQNKLMVFTDIGLQYFDPTLKQFEQYYSSTYGFGENVSTATLLNDGSLAVGNSKYINIFNPTDLYQNAETPKPYISSFSVFDETWSLKNSPNQIDTVNLSYQQNFFSFEFSAIAYNISEETVFSYMLKGFDENWQDGSKRRFAAYTNVPGGDYQFIVKAQNNEGVELDSPSITYLHISTVWYKTNWFILLSIGFLLALGYSVYKWQIGQVRKEERLKSDYEKKLANVEMSALRAQMNPHFIFNSLNSIEYYIINNNSEKASDYLNRFSRLIRLILQNSKSTVVSLKDDLEALKLYIEMESMRFDDLFDYELKIESDIDLDKIMVPPMLLQPYVENAIWHGLMQKVGERGKLELTLKRQNRHLACIVEDNGIGRQAASKLKSKSATRRKSYGMKITSDRLSMLNKLAGSNASVQVLDLMDEHENATGTRVELIIPLQIIPIP